VNPDREQRWRFYLTTDKKPETHYCRQNER
jgi:hypothetical protein